MGQAPVDLGWVSTMPLECLLGIALQVVPRLECHASSQGRCPRDGSCQASSQFSLRGHRAPRHCIQVGEEHGGRGGVTLGDWSPQPENQRQALPYFTVLLTVIRICSFYCYSHKTESSISLTPYPALSCFSELSGKQPQNWSRSWMLQLLALSEASVLIVGAAFLSFVKGRH